jgi:MoaA/NifB/PqqE/SkfB family radical SAM enzyme
MNREKRMLSIHLTDLCNNKCIFCVVDSPYQKAELASKEKIYKFLEENKNKGFEGVNIHGGEPTVRKDFIEILQKINECKYPEIVLQTNARKFSNFEFTKQIIELGVSYFVVSVHGANNGTHDYITQMPGSLKEAVDGIKNIKKIGATVRTNTVVSKSNYKELLNTCQLLVDLKVDHINISAIHTAGTAFRNFDDVVPFYDDIQIFVKEAVDFVNMNKIKITLEGFPFCKIEEMEKYVIDWSNQKFKMLFRNYIIEDYENYMDKMMRVQGEVCHACSENKKCGGVYKEYVQKFGWKEFGYGHT